MQASTLNVNIERDLDPKVMPDRDRASEIGDMADHDLVTGDDHDSDERNRWEKAIISFTLLKAKIASTPILRHFDPDRPLVIVVYASKGAVSAALLQNHDGIYWPVTFSSRTLKFNEVNYGMVEKEVGTSANP